jgi:hypothetical protein
MRFESSVTSISWIPSEAITGMTKVPFTSGIAHYDEPPPDLITDLGALRDADRFRFANELRAWIDVHDDPVTWGGRTLTTGGTKRIAAFGFAGDGMIGSTTLRLGSKAMTFAAVAFPTLRSTEVTDTYVRFTQTSGGRTGVPAPRPVKHPPFFQITAPIAWTTLTLTLHIDGRAEFSVSGASPFPRHWIYDAEGKLASKTGSIDFKQWSATAFGARTPWGAHDSPALVTEVESALERELSVTIMRGGRKPQRRKIAQGATLTNQGDPGAELYLLLDGVLAVEVDGAVVAEVGPGAILGERSILEGGIRTSTLRARTPCLVAAASAEDLDRDMLAEIAQGHRREETPA